MNLLIFEYITGGGFNRQEIPASLAKEGGLMLSALLENFSAMPEINITLMLDYRFLPSFSDSKINIATLTPDHNVHEEFFCYCRTNEAVWPVAPEFDGILQNLCRQVTDAGKLLLTSPASAVAATADKFTTWQALSRLQIPTAATRLFQDCRYLPGEWIIKPIDGAGSSQTYLIFNQTDFSVAVSSITDFSRYIIQPHLEGEKTSLSCLFKQGEAWVISANLQEFSIHGSQYRLDGCRVNHQPPKPVHVALANQVAQAFPDLWGYAGIDLIDTPERTWVLEINPRLTTSFAGIDAALGINVAREVLALRENTPKFNPLRNQPIDINLKHES